MGVPMAELRLPIIVENKGKKAFKDVDKGVKGLTKDFKKLAGAAGIGLSTAAVINFGKAAAKAFIADEKAASRLAMSVKNLGLGFETPRIERYISDLSRMSGITDDQLRPAMQRLLQTTGSVTKSQELLTQALDISRGSGVDYETVVADLSAAYVGNTKGLKKYSLGLSQAELKTMKFADVQAKFAARFKGGNAAYLDTYAGKFELIATAAGEAQEKIGGALVDSLVSVFAAGDPVEFVAKIEALSVKIADMVAQVVFGFKKLYYLTSDQAVAAAFNPFDDYENQVMRIIDSQEKAFLASFNRIKIGYLGSMPVGIYTSAVDLAKQKKAEADALKRQKELAKLQAKTAADALKKAAIDKAARTLELDRIGIEAALKGKISETDKLSLNLQLALLDKNDAAATKLSSQLETAIKNNALLQAALLATPEAPNPYRNWVAPGMAPLTTQGSISSGGGGVMPDFNVPANSYSQVGPMGGLGAGVIAGVNPPVNVTVTIDGKELTSIITDTQINNSLSGSFNQVNRGSGFKGAVAL
jgi:hypothetical protein